MDEHASNASFGGPATIRFTGENAMFRRLVTKGALLELVTFGFYRFWLTTDIRRHLWSNTEVDGDAMEYTGRGKELLLGFLIALAILAPAFFLYFLAGIESERYKARRYRLTRTVWRGVRFWMTGSGWSYAWRSLLWGLLVGLTLGFAYPFRSAALERYKLGHTFYGNLPARFEATGGALFKRVWWIWLFGLMAAFGAFGGPLLVNAIGHATGHPWNHEGLIGFIALLLYIALPFLHAMRMATEWRWWAEGIRFGDMAVACELKRSALFGVYWKLIGIGVIVFFVFGVTGGVAFTAVFGSIGQNGAAALLTHPPVWALVALAVWYLLLLLTAGILARIYLLQRVWTRVANACLLRNAAAATHVMAAGEAASALGEGLADGLDFAGF